MKATAIWSPRYYDRTVLVATRDVSPNKCYVYFCCDRNYSNLYSYDGMKVLSKCETRNNGKLNCYVIPLDWLQNEGELPEEFKLIRDREYQKFKKRKEQNKLA